MVIATSFYEPAATAIEGISAAASYTYLLDFIVLVGACLRFRLRFLRAITRLRSARRRWSSILPVEMAGRSILALVCGWMMVCFVAFSLQMAPLNSADAAGGLGHRPRRKTFAAVSPDRLWLGFMYSRSRPAALGGNQFDPNAEFLLRYRDRRVKYCGSRDEHAVLAVVQVPGSRFKVIRRTRTWDERTDCCQAAYFNFDLEL